jgi:hypothetical protein
MKHAVDNIVQEFKSCYGGTYTDTETHTNTDSKVIA